MRASFFLVTALAMAVSTSACTDAERCAIGSEGCVCDEFGGCGSGLQCDSATQRCVPQQNLCGDTCSWSGDGVCDDGGPDSEYAACDYGSDCADCGARPLPVCNDPSFPDFCEQSASCWETGVDCSSVAQCTVGNFYACYPGSAVDCSLVSSGFYCVDQTAVCSDSCPASVDSPGVCDDGGTGSTTAACRLGTDCDDCGSRESPCASDVNYPVFCPATPNAPSECWSPGTDCDSVQMCPDLSFYGCDLGYTYDCAAASCVLTSCADPTPVDCGTGTCFPVDTDCTTVTSCVGGTGEFGCPFGFVVDCSSPTTPACIVAP